MRRGGPPLRRPGSSRQHQQAGELRGRAQRDDPAPPGSRGRLHVRYDAEHFPDDLVFQETSDRTNFQGRYVLRHRWNGSDDCPEARQYRERLAARGEQEAATLANLTDWSIDEIRKKMDLGAVPPKPNGRKWWQKMWGQ